MSSSQTTDDNVGGAGSGSGAVSLDDNTIGGNGSASGSVGTSGIDVDVDAGIM
jgi:hypothetical protein